MDHGIEEETGWIGDGDMTQMRRSVRALHRLHRLVGVLTDRDTLLERIAEESRWVAEAEACSLMLYDPVSKVLFFQVAIGESGDQEALKRDIRLQLGQGIAGHTAASRDSVIVNDAPNDPRFFPDADTAAQFTTRNLLAVPMLDRGELIGVLELVNKMGGETFSDLDMHVMEMFASLAATAIVNARLIEERLRNERLAIIGQAVTSLSHYTKNIVSGLNSSADLIDMGLDKGNLDALRRSWPVFKRSTKRITHFVQDMLSFSKPRTPLRELFRIEAVLDEACDLFRELFAMKQISLEVDTSGVTGSVYADREALFRCLLNLLTNAADAVPSKGGRIGIRAQTRAGQLSVVVEDNGPGVPEAIREQIFDPFFSSKGSKGTGLGLAVTRKILREHGGDIRVSGTAGQGAVFTFEIPAKPPEEKVVQE
jgi:signal transduction histidine kinase